MKRIPVTLLAIAASCFVGGTLKAEPVLSEGQTVWASSGPHDKSSHTYTKTHYVKNEGDESDGGGDKFTVVEHYVMIPIVSSDGRVHEYAHVKYKEEWHGNPAPDDSIIAEKNDPLTPGGGNPLAPGTGDKPGKAPLTKWTKEFRDFGGLGGSIQAKGSRDSLINPDPDDSGDGGGGKKPKHTPIDEKDQNIFQKIGLMEQMLAEQFNGMNFSLVDIDYIRLHNPADKSTDSQGDGGGGTSAAGAAPADKMGSGPPNIKDAQHGALVNPDPFASNQHTPGNNGMGLPGGLDSPGGGNNLAGLGGGAGSGGGTGLGGGGQNTGSGGGTTGSTPQAGSGKTRTIAVYMPGDPDGSAADTAKRRRQALKNYRKALLSAENVIRLRQVAKSKAANARRRAIHAASTKAAARAKRAATARKSARAWRRIDAVKRSAMFNRRIPLALKRRMVLNNSARTRAMRLR